MKTDEDRDKDATRMKTDEDRDEDRDEDEKLPPASPCAPFTPRRLASYEKSQ